MTKLVFNSTYERFHGNKSVPSTPCEADILRYKRFSQLETTLYLQPLAVKYIENWTTLGDEKRYVSLVVACVRDLYTFVKSLIPSFTKNAELYMWPKSHQLVKQEKIKTTADVVKAVTVQNVLESSGLSEFNSAYSRVFQEIRGGTAKTIQPNRPIVSLKPNLAQTGY